MSTNKDKVDVIEDVIKGEGGDPVSNEPASKTEATEPKSTPTKKKNSAPTTFAEGDEEGEPEVTPPTPEELYQEDVKEGRFDKGKSKIVVKPTTVESNGTTKIEITVSLFSESDNTRPLVGVSDISLVFKDKALITAPFSKSENGNYIYTATAPKEVGSNTIGFKTKAGESTSTAKITYTQPAPTPEELYQEDVKGGKFDKGKSTIDINPIEIDADGKTTFDITIALYSESDSKRMLEGVTGLEVTGGKLVTKLESLGENKGYYYFRGTAPKSEGSDTFKFKTKAGASTSSATITYKEVIPMTAIAPQLVTYHDFPFDNRALLQLHFAVLYEINRIQDENEGEWNKLELYQDSKYAKEIHTISHLIETVENPQFQESKNGYILSKERMLEGNFYKF